MSPVNNRNQMVNSRIARRLVAPALVAVLILAALLSPLSMIRAVKAEYGVPDTSYGVNGEVVLPTLSRSEYPRAAIQPDGKLVVAYNWFNDNLHQSRVLAVVRFLPTGELDTIGSWPLVVLDVSEKPNSIFPMKVLIRPDGKILVAYQKTARWATSARVSLLHSNGTIDKTFVIDSALSADSTFGPGNIYDFVVLPDNRLVTITPGGLKSFDANGSLVSTVSVPFPPIVFVPNYPLKNGRIGRLAVDHDGRIVVTTAVTTPSPSGAPPPAELTPSLLMRYNADLTMDGSFCGGSPCSFPGPILEIDIGNDGKIVTMTVGKVGRHQLDGSLDTSFGLSGQFNTGEETASVSRALKVDALGRVVIATLEDSSFFGFSDLWVIQADGSSAERLPASANPPAAQIMLQADGKLSVVAGDGSDFYPARLIRIHYADERRAANLRFAKTKIIPLTGIRRDDEIEYVIRVVNDGPDKAGHVTFENPLPSGTSFVSFEAPEGWVTYQRPLNMLGLLGGKISCSGYSLESGQIAEFRMTVRVKRNVAHGTQITNTSTVKSLVPDLVPLNNTTTATVTVQ